MQGKERCEWQQPIYNSVYVALSVNPFTSLLKALNLQRQYITDEDKVLLSWSKAHSQVTQLDSSTKQVNLDYQKVNQYHTWCT